MSGDVTRKRMDTVSVDTVASNKAEQCLPNCTQWIKPRLAMLAVGHTRDARFATTGTTLSIGFHNYSRKIGSHTPHTSGNALDRLRGMMTGAGNAGNAGKGFGLHRTIDAVIGYFTGHLGIGFGQMELGYTDIRISTLLDRCSA